MYCLVDAVGGLGETRQTLAIIQKMVRRKEQPEEADVVQNSKRDSEAFVRGVIMGIGQG